MTANVAYVPVCCHVAMYKGATWHAASMCMVPLKRYNSI